MKNTKPSSHARIDTDLLSNAAGNRRLQDLYIRRVTGQTGRRLRQLSTRDAQTNGR